MKTLLIVAAIIVFLVHGFVMYCCIKVGAESEKNYDELAKGINANIRMYRNDHLKMYKITL